MANKGCLDGKQMAGAFALLNSRDLVWSRMVHDCLMGGKHSVHDLIAWSLDATRKAGARYIGPYTWRATMPKHEGSWWPAPEHWLRRQSGERLDQPSMGKEAGGYPVPGDASARYVLVP